MKPHWKLKSQNILLFYLFFQDMLSIFHQTKRRPSCSELKCLSLLCNRFDSVIMETHKTAPGEANSQPQQYSTTYCLVKTVHWPITTGALLQSYCLHLFWVIFCSWFQGAGSFSLFPSGESWGAFWTHYDFHHRDTQPHRPTLTPSYFTITWQPNMSFNNYLC